MVQRAAGESRCEVAATWSWRKREMFQQRVRRQPDCMGGEVNGRQERRLAVPSRGYLIKVFDFSFYCFLSPCCFHK